MTAECLARMTRWMDSDSERTLSKRKDAFWALKKSLAYDERERAFSDRLDEFHEIGIDGLAAVQT